MRLDQGRTPAETLPVVAARHPTARLVLEYLVLQGHTRAAQAYARDVAPIAPAPHLPPAEVQRMRVRQRMGQALTPEILALVRRGDIEEARRQCEDAFPAVLAEDRAPRGAGPGRGGRGDAAAARARRAAPAY